MKTTNIVALDGHTMNPGDLSWEGIEKLGNLTIYERTPISDTISRASEADILLVNKHPLTKDDITQLPNLKCICVTATGFNNVDIDAAAELKIPVCNVSGYSTESVAQHVFALILNFMNQPKIHSNTVHDKKWSNCPDFSYHVSPLRDLSRKTMGIYGFGKIGQRVAEIAQAFHMNVIATHKHPMRDRRAGVSFVHLEELFEKSDFISLHAPLNIENVGIVNKRLLSLMKPSAYLINTARGPLINELDLKDALDNNTLSGAGLDVLSKEPPPVDHPLIGVKNCIITPHIAWASFESRQKLMLGTQENIKAFIEGRPRNMVNDF